MNTSQVMSHSNFEIVRNSFYCLHVLAEFVKCVVAFHSHILPKLKIKIFDCEPYCLVYDVKQTKSEKKKCPVETGLTRLAATPLTNDLVVLVLCVVKLPSTHIVNTKK